MTDHDTYSTAGPICPYCKFEHTPDDPGYYDENQTEMECGQCDREFKVEVYHDTSWSCSPEKIEGFEIGDSPSDGETLCTGCWDKSEHDTNANNDIPEGEPVYYQCVSVMYDEWDAYCYECAKEKCARETASEKRND